MDRGFKRYSLSETTLQQGNFRGMVHNLIYKSFGITLTLTQSDTTNIGCDQLLKSLGLSQYPLATLSVPVTFGEKKCFSHHSRLLLVKQLFFLTLKLGNFVFKAFIFIKNVRSRPNHLYLRIQKTTIFLTSAKFVIFNLIYIRICFFKNKVFFHGLDFKNINKMQKNI